jgi:hypothetical protein
MDSFDTVDTETILSGQSDWIGPDLMEALSQHPLDCMETEFPHFSYSVDSPNEIERPKERHPVFYGCFDWHSSVHSHWCLIRQLRLFDDHPDESAIVSSMEGRLTTENVEQEAGYFDTNESSEKPYGWAWFLRLVSELHLWEDDRADNWREILKPLEEQIVNLVETEFLPQERPFRVGTHHNSAFAIQCVLDYARVVSDNSLESDTLDTSREFFVEDRNYPVEYEPLGWDFLSPALAETDLMRRVLNQDEFVTWISNFLPDITTSPYDSILSPIRVNPESDGGIELHLVGLNISKAWCLMGLASVLDDRQYIETFEQSAKKHIERGLKLAFTEDYAGAHWLSSFVLYLLTRNEGAIAPRS